MNRRKFIEISALSTGIGLSMPNLIGKSIFETRSNQQLGFADNDNIMIIVELFGGNDGLNTVIPVNDPRYYELRPNISIAGSDAIQWGDSSLYLHPALVTNQPNNGFMGLLDQGKLAIIEGIGYQNPNQSHFRSSDIWHSGIISNDPGKKLLEGWVGRFVASKLTNYPFEIPEQPIAISMSGLIPLLLKSNKGHMGIALNNPEDFIKLGKGLDPSESTMNSNEFFANEFNFVHVIANQCATYSNAVGSAYEKGVNLSEYSDGRLTQNFKNIAKLISGGLKTKIYYVGLSSFDNHVQQRDPFNPLDGQHPELLAELAGAISTFMEDMTQQGFSERIAGFTFSEFGRRAHDNGSRGTDHGAASNLFVFGHNNYIRGGRFGFEPNLSDLDSNQNLRARPEEDFRRLYADFLIYWLGATQEEVDQVFGEPVDPIDVLSLRTSVKEYIKGGKEFGLNIYPNPSRGYTYFEFELLNYSKVEVLIYSLDGKINKKIIDSYLFPGIIKTEFMIEYTGTYTLVAIINNRRYTKIINIIK